MKTPDILPTQYRPRSVEQFYGPARQIAKVLQRSADMCLPAGVPAAHLIIGASGSGKTELATYALEKCFKVSQWNMMEIFGSDISVERVRELAMSMRLTSLYPGFRGFLLDEVNVCTKEARDRLLEVVGDRKQANNTVIIATANMTVEQFDNLEKTEDAKGRFTSRFQVHECGCPKAADLVPLIETWLPKKESVNICEMAGGGKAALPINVRGILRDVLTVMQSIAI